MIPYNRYPRVHPPLHVRLVSAMLRSICPHIDLVGAFVLEDLGSASSSDV